MTSDLKFNIMQPQFTIGTFGIIFDKHKRVLLCHRRDHDLWNLPGGGLESGESPWDGVLREVKEETGLKVEVSKLAGIYSKPGKDNICFSFVCKVSGGKITLNAEADKIEYFALNKIPSNTAPKQVERIRDVVKTPNKISLKIQNGKSSLDLIKAEKL